MTEGAVSQNVSFHSNITKQTITKFQVVSSFKKKKKSLPKISGCFAAIKIQIARQTS